MKILGTPLLFGAMATAAAAGLFYFVEWPVEPASNSTPANVDRALVASGSMQVEPRPAAAIISAGAASVSVSEHTPNREPRTVTSESFAKAEVSPSLTPSAEGTASVSPQRSAESESPALTTAPDLEPIPNSPLRIGPTELQSVAAPSSPAPATPPAATAVNAQPQKLPMPLVFQNIDAAASGLTEPDAQTLDAVRAKFVADIGGPNQNVNDPGYAQRWTKAQRFADEQLRRFFGNYFADQVSIKAAQAEYAASQRR
jgi:hypothetical protein